ncbi:MAG: hypothetical protein HYZ16_02755 [Bacteroidetes bacterium]|nr:hypothetical protein [Bacteroidota bacterium]
MPIFQALHIILFVADQEISKQFYGSLWQMAPRLHVPGMTEFELANGLVLGLMPTQGAARLLGNHAPHPATAQGVPRSELYLYVKHLDTCYAHALACGARLISPPLARNWGDLACYFSDPDGHIIALAEKLADNRSIKQ